MEKDLSPETENPSPVKNADLIDEKSPAPGNPSPDSAAPVNPTLLSINITKDLKTAEEEKGSETEKLNSSKEVAAAVSFSKTQKEALDTLSYSPSDSVIGKDLTSNQLKRVEGIVRELRPGNADTLIQEITFCLLNPNHFTGCGKDFLKKLNTIRSVIRKGDWQRPAGMVIEKKSQVKNELAPLEAELSQAYAEVQHFERLAKKAKPESVSQFKGFVAQAQLKIKKLEGQIEAILEHFKKQDIAVC